MAIYACTSQSPTSQLARKNKSALVTTVPLRGRGEGKGNLTTLIPLSSSPHLFLPTPETRHILTWNGPLASFGPLLGVRIARACEGNASAGGLALCGPRSLIMSAICSSPDKVLLPPGLKSDHVPHVHRGKWDRCLPGAWPR